MTRKQKRIFWFLVKKVLFQDVTKNLRPVLHIVVSCVFMIESLFKTQTEKPL